MRTFLVGCLLLGTRAAAADPLEGLALEGWYGKLGVESGVAFGRERGAAPILGGVATFVHINDAREWLGFQADLLADGNGELATGARWSIGPEGGVSIYGVDVSYFGERVAGATHQGFSLRAKLTVGIAAIYARTSFSLVGGDEQTFDVGIQLKAPLLIRRPHRGAPTVATR
jgi:hypothetical protein